MKPRRSTAELRARLAELRKGARRGRGNGKARRRNCAILAILLLLILWPCCSALDVVPEAGPGTESPGAQGVEATPDAPLSGRIPRKDRPAFVNNAPESLLWVASFRLQVAARGARLAQCFVGAERPGAIKWTASVEPVSGRVSDHVLEPAHESEPLTAEQKGCVIAVVSDPPYRLEGGGVRATPQRVAVAIEF